MKYSITNLTKCTKFIGKKAENVDERNERFEIMERYTTFMDWKSQILKMSCPSKLNVRQNKTTQHKTNKNPEHPYAPMSLWSMLHEYRIN